MATTNAGGAKNFPDEIVPFFKGDIAVVLPDHDGAGVEHVEVVTEKLRGIVKSLRVLPLPGLLKPKDDIIERFAQGYTFDELLKLVETAEETQEPAPGEKK